MYWDLFAIGGLALATWGFWHIAGKLDRVINLLEIANQQRSDANECLRSIELDSEAIRAQTNDL